MPETMRAPTRIFTQGRSAWSASLLVLGVMALVLGIFGAVRLQRDDHPATSLAAPPPAPAAQPMAQAAPPAPVAATPPAVAMAVTQAQPQNPPQNPIPTPPTTQALAAPAPTVPAVTATTTAPAVTAAPAPVEAPAPPAPLAATPAPAVPPAAAAVAPAAAARAELQSPPAAAALNGATTNPAATVGPQYWVEFGAYTHARYAERLKNNLERLGIKATVTLAHGHGREYLRVRTVSESDHSAALAQWSKAHRALQIRPLLHRVEERVAAADHTLAATPNIGQQVPVLEATSTTSAAAAPAAPSGGGG